MYGGVYGAWRSLGEIVSASAIFLVREVTAAVSLAFYDESEW